MSPRSSPDSLTSWLRLLPLALLLLPAAGCSKKAPPMQMPPRPVHIAPVEQKDVPLYIDSIGKCTALYVVSIQPQVSGQLMKMHFVQGQEVKKDSLLFTIDPRTYQAAFDKAEADVANDRALLKNQEAQLRRSRELVAGEFISPQDIETLEANVAQTKAKLQADLATVAEAKVNLDYCSIRSPVEGRTGILLVDVGNIVSSAAPNSLISVQTLDPIYVDFTIVEKDLAAVRKRADVGKLKLTATPLGPNQAPREGELFVVDNTVQPGTGTVKLRAILPNADRGLWPEQFVNVRLTLESIKGALLVPSEAVKTGQMGPFLFVVKPDMTLDLRAVRPGQAQGDRVVIEHGLQAGERVVVGGQLMLAPGAKVMDAASMPKGPPPGSPAKPGA